HRQLRVGDARASLVADLQRQRLGVAQVDPARVDQREAAAVPLALELLAVARHTRALVHHRLARAREAVDERGLAHVRIADHRDLHGPSMPRASASTRCTTASTSRPLVSSVTAPGAARSGLYARVESRASRSVSSAVTVATS